MAIAPKKIRKAIGGLKDQTSIGFAKVGGARAADLDVALVKATSHDDYFDEKYVQEILHLTSHSRGYVSACVTSLGRRLAKTHDWNVALKGLMLCHRLLRDGDPSFENELMHATRRGRRILNLSNFKDETHSNAWDYSSFVRTYGLFLDERLDCSLKVSGKNKNRRGRGERGGRGRPAYSKSPERSNYRSSPDRDAPTRYGGSPDSRAYSIATTNDVRRHSNYDGGLSPRYSNKSGRKDSWKDDRSDDKGEDSDNVPIKEMNVKQLLVKLPAMQRLMDRVLGCRPAGAAKTNRLVQHALYPIIKESFQLHRDICDGSAVLLESFFDMEQKDRVKAHEIFITSAKQSDELHEFLNLCKHHGIGRSSEYIEVAPIPKEQLDNLEEYLRSNAPTRTRSKSPEAPTLQLEYRTPTPQQSPKSEPAPAPEEEAPQVVVEPEPAPAPAPAPVPAPTPPVGDLLDMGKATISTEDHSEKLALALFSTSTTTSTWETFNSDDKQSSLQPFNASESGKAGWELALVESASNLSKPAPDRPLAGGFDNLLLDSMYNQGEVLQKQAVAAAPTGSASSVAIPNRPSSAFLALPAPPGAMPLPLNGEDPFAASAIVPPPAYVQMADLDTKQQLLTQEQIMWQRYQMEGMRGEATFQKVLNNPYAGMQGPAPMMQPYQNPYTVGMPVGYQTPY